MMKHSLIAFLAFAIVGVSGQRFGGFDRESRGRGRPGFGPRFGLGFPGIFNPGFPFFPPPIFRFGNPIDSIFCQNMQPDSKYRLTISSADSNQAFNVTGQDLINCLSEEGKQCSTAVIFNDDFLSCVEKAGGGGSNSTEPTTVSSVTGSGSEDTILRVSTMTPIDDSNGVSASEASTAAPVADDTPTPVASDATPAPSDSASSVNDVSNVDTVPVTSAA